MRLFVIIVLMALLPLRGWAGDGMAIRMAIVMTSSMAGQHGGGPAQATASTQVAAEHADCVEHANMATAQSAAAGDKAAKPASPDHCSTCPTCQACFAVGLLVPTIELPAQLPHTSFLHDRAVAVFASADLAHSQKPPIS
jgi:membrane protease subunit (stomatin/prohibitin family)